MIKGIIKIFFIVDGSPVFDSVEDVELSEQELALWDKIIGNVWSKQSFENGTEKIEYFVQQF